MLLADNILFSTAPKGQSISPLLGLTCYSEGVAQEDNDARVPITMSAE